MKIEFGQEYPIAVLGEAEESRFACYAQKLIGRRLIVRLAEALEPDAAVRVDLEDALLLGEVQGCWREGDATFAAIGICEVLTGLDEIARNSRWRRGYYPPVRHAAGEENTVKARRYGWMMP